MWQRWSRGKRFLLWMVSGVIASLLACSSPPTNLPIGLIAPLSGDLAPTSGTPTLQGAELAVNVLNEAGGVELDGRRYTFTLVPADDEDNPNQAVAVANRLINQEQVVVLVGMPLSRIAIPVSQVAENAQIPMISSKSTNPATTQDKDYVFRVTFTDTFQGEAIAEFAKNELNLTQAAILYDDASNYNKFLAETFQQAFTQRGGQIVALESYITNETNFEPQLTRIRDSGAELIFLPNYPVEVIEQARQIRQLGIDAILLGGDAWSGFAQYDEPALDGSYYSADWALDLDNPQMPDFLARYQATYDTLPTSAAALSYDTIGLIAAAMRQANDSTPQGIREGLSTMRDYPGVTGLISYQDSGDPQKGAVILRLEAGNAVFDRQVMP
ncbi:ABC transporter substrate-binding protein [Spirulina subsalsa]|uniref:ABC transporter substrate-binding protein n=1 Tax=Spirulina subsalsa TaxID=54311 RepID=UPI000305116D|nr:ABC transporter substrate-binding protein [Spirulina subsalsa]